MNNQIKLSICIPVYNRKNMLDTLLQSIILQMNEEQKKVVEITISDNASTDGTEKFIENFIRKYLDVNLIYGKNETNLGPDWNYIKAVGLSHGEYAWIVGSDDALYPDAISRVLKEIESKDIVYISSRDNYDIDLKQYLGRQCFYNREFTGDKTLKLDSIENWDFYLNLCTSLGGVMSYLSSIVFNRAMWDRVKDYEEYIGSAYVHVYILFKMLLYSKSSMQIEKVSLRILNRPLVKCRQGNDSFYRNRYQRMMLDFDGYIKLARIFENPLLKRDFLAILKRVYPVIPFQIILGLGRKECEDLISKMRAAGYHESEIENMVRMQKHKLLTILLYLDRIYGSMKRRMIGKGK